MTPLGLPGDPRRQLRKPLERLGWIFAIACLLASAYVLAARGPAIVRHHLIDQELLHAPAHP